MKKRQFNKDDGVTVIMPDHMKYTGINYPSGSMMENHEAILEQLDAIKMGLAELPEREGVK